MAVKQFRSEILTSGDVNTYLANSGLVYVTSVNVGSGVSSVSVTGCFSSTYDAYRIEARGVSCSGEGSATLQLLSGSTPLTTGYYGSLIYSSSNAVATATDVNTSAYGYICANGNTAGLSLSVDVVSPAKAEITWIANGAYIRYNFYGTYNGYNNSSVAYDGFKVAPQTGTLTGGTITVYGYRKA